MAAVNLTVVCNETASRGFELAGIAATGIGPGDDAVAILEHIAAAARWGLVLVADNIMDALPGDVRDTLARSRRPVFVSLPIHPPHGRAAAEIAGQKVEESIQRAVGRKIALADIGRKEAG